MVFIGNPLRCLCCYRRYIKSLSGSQKRFAKDTCTNRGDEKGSSQCYIS